MSCTSERVVKTLTRPESLTRWARIRGLVMSGSEIFGLLVYTETFDFLVYNSTVTGPGEYTHERKTS